MVLRARSGVYDVLQNNSGTLSQEDTSPLHRSSETLKSRIKLECQLTNAASAYIYDKAKQRRERKRLDKLARQQAVRNAKSSLITSAIVNSANAGVKLAATSVVNSPDASEGARLFAKYMGGEEKKEKNSLDLLKTKSMNDMSDNEISDVNARLTKMNHIDTILDAQRKKRAQTGSSNQNGSSSYSITVR